jgi:hypothetical protein
MHGPLNVKFSERNHRIQLTPCTSLSEQLEVFSLLLYYMKDHHPIHKSSTDLYQLNSLPIPYRISL